MKKIIGIPARMGSSRFPGKPLCKILGLTMIEHCYLRSKLSEKIDDVFVAICDEELKNFCIKKNINYIMTDPTIPRPGLRVCEAAKSLDLDENDIVITIQGDEPLINPKMIDQSIDPLLRDKNIYASNLCAIIKEKDLNDPNEIKVVCDNNMNAIYMSRSPIPSQFHEEKKTDWFKQVCVMPFKWGFLKKFNDELKRTELELQESIEMLRAIQHGYKIKMILTNEVTKSVDCENDRLEVEKIMKIDSYTKLYLTKL